MLPTAQPDKTVQPGKKKEVQYFRLDKAQVWSPVATLNAYLKRTEQMWNGDLSKSQLLLSVVRPFRAVSKTTITRWAKSLIHEAGVGKQFSAHSIRGAASHQLS